MDRLITRTSTPPWVLSEAEREPEPEVLGRAGRPNSTVAALPAIIDQLRAAGYELVLPDAMAPVAAPPSPPQRSRRSGRRPVATSPPVALDRSLDADHRQSAPPKRCELPQGPGVGGSRRTHPKDSGQPRRRSDWIGLVCSRDRQKPVSSFRPLRSVTAMWSRRRLAR